MTQTEIERLQELRQKEQLTEKEFAQWEFLEKKVINDERIEQFRKNQQEPYNSKRSRAVNLAWEFFRAVEGRPHRFDLLWERNPKEWDMWMNHVCQDADGNWYGWGHVLDYIGVKWRNPQKYIDGKRAAEAVVQISLFGGDQV